jgi:hypothetical protein
MNLSIPDNEKDTLLSSLKIANLKFQQTYPGDKRYTVAPTYSNQTPVRKWVR